VTTVAAQLFVAAQIGPDERGFTPGCVSLKKFHSTPVSRTITAIAPSGGSSGLAPAGMGARMRRASQVG
jgi:hypothetical protein